MRCLTLADSLRAHGAEVAFVCREHTGHLCELILEKGFLVHRLPAPLEGFNDPHNLHAEWVGVTAEIDARDTLAAADSVVDWLIVDHYGLDHRWEELLRGVARRIMVIDDLANRRHECDLLLDQNYYQGFKARYDHLVPPHCEKLLGPSYALLRPAFRLARKHVKPRHGSVNRILVFFGGYDQGNMTSKALDAILAIDQSNLTIDVVVGEKNPNKDSVRARCYSAPNVQFHCQVDNMAELMSKADLAIGSGGSTIWERCALGLPALLVAVADHEELLLNDLASLGILVYLGRDNALSSEMLRNAIRAMLRNEECLHQVSQAALQFVDGNGLTAVLNTLTSSPLYRK